MGNELIKISEASKRYGISIYALKELVKKGRLSAYEIGPKLLMINPIDIERFLKESEVKVELSNSDKPAENNNEQ
jgi:hypothetical protein